MTYTTFSVILIIIKPATLLLVLSKARDIYIYVGFIKMVYFLQPCVWLNLCVIFHSTEYIGIHTVIKQQPITKM